MSITIDKVQIVYYNGNLFSRKYNFSGKIANIIYQLQEAQVLINLRIFYSSLLNWY